MEIKLYQSHCFVQRNASDALWRTFPLLCTIVYDMCISLVQKRQREGGGGKRAFADQTVKPTNDLQPAAAMTDGVLGNLKEPNERTATTSFGS